MDSVYLEETLTLLERRHEYGSVFSYVFSPSQPVAYEAGQYGHVRLFGMPSGEKAVREFSFASSPEEENILFGIDSRSGSAYQQALSALPIGGTAGLFKIKGHMTWPSPTSRSAVMIAGGVGVTPFRSMLLNSRAKAMDIQITLIHAGRGGFLYREELVHLAHAYVPVSRENLSDAIVNVCGMSLDAQFYVAGSPLFVEGVAGMLAEKGIHKIETDPFKGLAE